MSRKMKNSGIEWIGEIPEEWEVIPCKFCFKICNGSDPVTTEGTTPVYGSGSKSFKTCEEYKEGPAVLLGRKGTINIPQWVSGKYWNVDTAFDAKPKGNYNLKLFFYVAVCFDYERYSTQTALPSMTQTDYSNSKIPYMKVVEQQQIASYLDSRCLEIDSLTADIKKQLEILEQYRKSVITEAVTKGLDPNARMKDSGIEWIGEIPEEWEVKKIKQCYEFKTGFTPDTSNADFYAEIDEGVDWFTIADISDQYFLPIRSKTQINRRFIELYHPEVTPAGSLLYSFKLSIGKTAFTQKEIYNNEAIAAFYPTDLNSLAFLKYSSSFIIYNANENIYGAKILNSLLINKAFVTVPPLSEQQQIALFLDSKCSKIDELIKLKNQQLEMLSQYKKSLIYEYVTGKKEVIE